MFLGRKANPPRTSDLAVLREQGLPTEQLTSPAAAVSSAAATTPQSSPTDAGGSGALAPPTPTSAPVSPNKGSLRQLRLEHEDKRRQEEETRAAGQRRHIPGSAANALHNLHLQRNMIGGPGSTMLVSK